MLTVIVLAAGLSRRMGTENKLLLPFQGKTILETTISNILEADIGDVIVVVGHEAEHVKNVVGKFISREKDKAGNKFPDYAIIENPDFEQGMTTSIKAGIRAPLPQRGGGESSNTEGYMICLSDMILIEPNEYQFLRNQFSDLYKQDEKVIVQPIFEEKRGNPVIFSPFYKKDILETTDTEGCRSVVQKHKNHLKLVEMATNHVLQDVDVKEDYEKLLDSKI